jgi:DNA-binding MarR family transcriptional regulator
MDSPKKETTIGFMSYRVAHSYMRVLEKWIRPLGIGASESFLIMHLHEKGRKSLVEIARHVGHAHPTVVRHIDSMEKSGIVTREPHESDRRVKVIHLTQAGIDMVPKLVQIYRDVEAGAICGLDEHEVKTFLNAANQMDDNLSVMAGPEENGDV